MLTEKTFDTGEVVLNFAESNNNHPPLVLLPGVTLIWQSLGELIPALEQSWHIYACDYRGHGKSGRATSGYRLADCALDVTALIERLICRPAVVLGFSWGASVALHVAARLPGLPRAVISLEPGLMLRDTRISSTWLYAAIKQIYDILTSSRTNEELIAIIKQSMPEIDEAGALFELNRIRSLDPAMLTYLLNDPALEDSDLDDVLPRVACPTLLVYGETDLGGLVRDSDVTRFKTHIPHSRMVQIKGAGHALLWSPIVTVTLEHVTEFFEIL